MRANLTKKEKAEQNSVRKVWRDNLSDAKEKARKEKQRISDTILRAKKKQKTQAEKKQFLADFKNNNKDASPKKQQWHLKQIKKKRQGQKEPRQRSKATRQPIQLR